jgi:DNA-binding protein HU-beta
MVKKPAPARKPAAAPKKAPAKTAAAAKAPAVKVAKPAAPARGAKAAASAAPATVTLKHLAAQIAEDHEMAKRQADAVLSDFVGLVVGHLKSGDRIRIGGLGILQVRARAARMGRNPATGEQIKIKASKKIAFRPAKELKEAI